MLLHRRCGQCPPMPAALLSRTCGVSDRICANSIAEVQSDLTCREAPSFPAGTGTRRDVGRSSLGADIDCFNFFRLCFPILFFLFPPSLLPHLFPLIPGIIGQHI